jgi:DNA-binding transcriptional regulator GbsR (MarR family)
MAEEEKTLDDKFITFMTKSFETFGFDKLSSTIFVILYLEEDMLTMEDIAKKTGYSLASVCNSIKSLERTSFLKVTHRPKTKRHYFTVEKNLADHMKLMIQMIRKAKIEPAKEALPAIITQYKNLKTKDKSTRYKLGLIEDFYKHTLKLEKITDFMESQL